MKRGYLVSVADGEFGVAVVAQTSKEAKSIARKNDIYDLFCDCEYTEIEVKWQKDSKVDDLSIGVIDNAILALERNIYGYVDGEKCPVCHEEAYLSNVDGKVMCSQCEEKADELNQEKVVA
jgi:hypothetical protein